MRVTCIAGGVGGARMALALQEALAPGELTVVGNVGDDTVHWGLHIAPDLDTVLYTLTGRIDPPNGWGVAGDTRHVMEEITGLGEDDWFILGDRDLALHISRTRRLAAGEPLSAITADVAACWGCPSRILAATDDRLRTWIATDDGELPFQEWLVRRRAADPVAGVRFEGVPGARPGPGLLQAIADADRIVLAPSNPFVSLDPILAVDGLRDAVRTRRADVVAVAPLIGGRAVKGPLVEMLASLGHRPDVVGAAGCVADVAGAYLLDPADAGHAGEVEALGLHVVTQPALLRDAELRAAVARAVLA